MSEVSGLRGVPMFSFTGDAKRYSKMGVKSGGLLPPAVYLDSHYSVSLFHILPILSDFEIFAHQVGVNGLIVVSLCIFLIINEHFPICNGHLSCLIYEMPLHLFFPWIVCPFLGLYFPY